MEIIRLNNAIACIAENPNVAPFSRMYIFLESGVNMAPVYSDSYLKSLTENPLKADESGHFSRFYLRDGIHRLIIKDPKGETIETHVVLVQSNSEIGFEITEHTVANVLGNTALRYDADPITERRVITDDRIFVSQGAHAYCVLDEAATDYDLQTTSGVKLKVEEGSSGKKSLKAFGAVGDGVTDDTAAVSAWAASGGTLLADPGTYLIKPVIQHFQDDTTIFAYGALFVASEASTQVIGIGHDSYNISIHGLSIDAQNFPGLNGVGLGGSFGTACRILLRDCHVENCRRSPITGGGRAIAMQNGVSKITLINVSALNCTTGLDVNGQDGQSGNLTPVTEASVYGYHIENCEEAISVYGMGVSSKDTVPPTNPSSTSFVAHGGYIRNCGLATDHTLYSGSGSPTDQDGGVIILRRGANVALHGIKIWNDDTYRVGGILRGMGNNVIMTHAEFFGNFDAVWNATGARNTLPAPETNDPAFGIQICGVLHGEATSIVHIGAGVASNLVSGCSVDIKVSEPSKVPVLLSTNSNYTWSASNWIRVRNMLNQSEISGVFSQIINAQSSWPSALQGRLQTDDLQLIGDLSVTGDSAFDGKVSVSGQLELDPSSRLLFGAVHSSAGTLSKFALVQARVGLDVITFKIPLYQV